MANMAKYGIAIVQNLYQDRSGEIHNEYQIYTEAGFCIGVLRLPSDGQYAFDYNFLIALMKGLAIRYGFIKPKEPLIKGPSNAICNRNWG